ncbi:hypothetical protein [Paraburkholderia sp. BL21I4N1]|uniref:hypothetical protein n=1 Tax=Paraburkholderia sp. BL21I4N1 TaxID=1938801 RepID=UPI000CFC5A82|nr:hypothetical protein [Paraburkholderia sp. BL21I4N1]
MHIRFDHHPRPIRKLDTFAPPARSPQRFAPLKQTPTADDVVRETAEASGYGSDGQLMAAGDSCFFDYGLINTVPK